MSQHRFALAAYLFWVKAALCWNMIAAHFNEVIYLRNMGIPIFDLRDVIKSHPNLPNISSIYIWTFERVQRCGEEWWLWRAPGFGYNSIALLGHAKYVIQ